MRAIQALLVQVSEVRAPLLIRLKNFGRRKDASTLSIIEVRFSSKTYLLSGFRRGYAWVPPLEKDTILQSNYLSTQDFPLSVTCPSWMFDFL